MLLPSALPQARGNHYGDDENAAKLGFYLFFDANLGSGVACVNCHSPETAFGDSKPVSMGKSLGIRHTPTVFNAARLKVFFWDGRADSLWSQPLFPMESAAEMATTRLAVAHFIASRPAYRADYEAAFGTMPDVSSWPAAGKPGDPPFDRLPADVRYEVNRVYANVGKAFEAYMRKNNSGPSSFDAYLGGDSTQLTDVAKRGLQVFLEHGCASCHGGPMLTDEGFHDVGFPSMAGAAPDPGRIAGISVLEASLFNESGPFADPDTGAAPETIVPVAPGAFRTPSLRNVNRAGPYGHDGALATLDDVMAVHATDLSKTERGEVISFLQSLTGATPPLPWSNWPSPQ
jgi:cytochrome c peroxidase